MALETDHEMFKLILSYHGTLENVPHKKTSPLCIAVSKKDFESVKLLVEKGVDVDFKTTNQSTYSFESRYLSPALLNAASNGDMKITSYLIEHGADVNSKGNNNTTALTIAIRLDNPNMMSFLMDNGAEIEGSMLLGAVNAKNMTALRKFIPILKKKGIQVDSQSLFQAAERHNFEAFRMLIESGLVFDEKQNDLLPSLLTEIFDKGPNLVFEDRDLTDEDETCPKDYFYKKEFIMLLLSNKYTFVSEETNCAVHNCIALRELGLLSALIYHGGFSPRILSLKSSYFCDVRDDLEESLRGVFSPFCMALLCGCISIARDMLKACFLTVSDLTRLPSNKQMIQILTDKNVTEGVDLLYEMSSTTPSLSQLSFIQVSDSLGNGPDRSDKIKHLGLPPSLQKALNFKCDYQIIGKEFLLSTAYNALKKVPGLENCQSESESCGVDDNCMVAYNEFKADLKEISRLQTTGLSLYKIIYLPNWYVDEICDPEEFYRRRGKDRISKYDLEKQYGRMNSLTKNFYKEFGSAPKDTEKRSRCDEEDYDSNNEEDYDSNDLDESHYDSDDYDWL